MLAPGWARLLTIPVSARSLHVATTIGRVVAASRASRARRPGDNDYGGRFRDSSTDQRPHPSRVTLAIKDVDLDRPPLDLPRLAHALEEALHERAINFPLGQRGTSRRGADAPRSGPAAVHPGARMQARKAGAFAGPLLNDLVHERKTQPSYAYFWESSAANEWLLLAGEQSVATDGARDPKGPYPQSRSGCSRRLEGDKLARVETLSPKS